MNKYKYFVHIIKTRHSWEKKQDRILVVTAFRLQKLIRYCIRNK